MRAAIPADLPEIARLLTVLNHEEGHVLSASSEALHRALFGDGARVAMRVLLAHRGNTIRGLALYYWGYDTVSASEGYHLADIVVDPAARGKTIGTQLFHTLAAQCLREGGQWISLTVLKRNAHAQRFYRARGMVEIAVNFYAIGPEGLARCAQ